MGGFRASEQNICPWHLRRQNGRRKYQITAMIKTAALKGSLALPRGAGAKLVGRRRAPRDPLRRSFRTGPHGGRCVGQQRAPQQ
eukprot:299779-Lingulodinium_polyedra.AAC.1